MRDNVLAAAKELGAIHIPRPVGLYGLLKKMTTKPQNEPTTDLRTPKPKRAFIIVGVRSTYHVPINTPKK